MDAGPGDRVWDVAIIGGGAAGLSAALTLARARRSVVVVDAGSPRNAPASAAHGLLGREGTNPMELLATGRQEAATYGAQILAGDVANAEAVPGGGSALTLGDGTTVRAGQLVIATGVRDELPAVPGLAERWGRDVVHCPYCHGWEIRDQRIGLLATGPMSALQALLFHQWSSRMRFFTHGIRFPAAELEKLAAVGIEVSEGSVTGLEVTDDRLTGVRLVGRGMTGGGPTGGGPTGADSTGGELVELDALAVPALTRARLEGLEGLGVETATNAAGVAVVADPAGHTSVPGVWAAGNVVNPGMQVSEAAANGARVAMTINTELVFQHADQALRARQPESV